MRLTYGIFMGALAATSALSGCAGKDTVPQLMNIRSQTRSPDEFSILPTKPMTMPEDISVLPEPTPGGSNITDPTPQADAVAALGGNPDALRSDGIAASNSALLSHASRFGRTSNIRETLASEDLDYRRKHDGRLLERIMNVNVYFRAYKPMALDQYAELARWRAVGARTVSAPPQGVETK